MEQEEEQNRSVEARSMLALKNSANRIRICTAWL